MSTDIRETRVWSLLYDLGEKDAAASSQSVRPERLSTGQVDGEVGRGRSSSRRGGHQDSGPDARTVRSQLRLGLICQKGSVTAARVTGKTMKSYCKPAL